MVKKKRRAHKRKIDKKIRASLSVFFSWRTRMDLNHRHQASEACALSWLSYGYPYAVGDAPFHPLLHRCASTIQGVLPSPLLHKIGQKCIIRNRICNIKKYISHIIYSHSRATRQYLVLPSSLLRKIIRKSITHNRILLW